MEKKISYLNRTYSDYRQALIDLSKTYYPEMSFNYDDASVGSWLIDLNAVIADELSYHIDRAYQETNINSAEKVSSIYTMARNNGFKVPGPKGAMCEVAFSCKLPVATNGSTQKEPQWAYAPVIKRGTKVSSGQQTFELLKDLDFKVQFNEDGASDRYIEPLRNANKEIIGYRVTKLAVVIAGETNEYKRAIVTSDVKPFMEILIPTENVMNIESIVMKDGSSLQSSPTVGEYYMPEETSTAYTGTTRFFEVDSLSQQDRWGDKGDKTVTDYFGYLTSEGVIPTYAVTKGEWKSVKHKFITEYTDKGYLKVIFGAGMESGTDDIDLSGSTWNAQYQIGKMLRNSTLGYLPKANSTIFIRYRSGGGQSSNVAKGAIKTISYLNAEINVTEDMDASVAATVKSSIAVESVTASVSGKDMPTVSELKNMIKYSSAAQNRCVTLKDYESRVLQMPPRYGCPFRVGAAEENNKVMLYLLGVNSEGELDTTLPTTLVENIQEYLSKYRMINDFVEIKSGKIINLAFEPYVIISKDYNAADVISNIKNTIKDYMDINEHQMGDDIFVGDISKEISKIDGVLNLNKLKVYNVYGNGYSQTRIAQATVELTQCDDVELYNDRAEIDLDASDGVIYSDGDSMLEVKKLSDISVQFKER